MFSVPDCTPQSVLSFTQIAQACNAWVNTVEQESILWARKEDLFNAA